MVDAKAVASLVVGVLLALFGGLGALAILLGTLAGAMEWTAVAWLLLLAFVVGAGLLTYGSVALAETIAGDGLSGLAHELDIYRLRELVD